MPEEIHGRYKKIVEDIEKNIKDPNTVDFVKDKLSELTMMFIDILDRLTKITYSQIGIVEEKQKEISDKINSIESIIDGIESDIYETEEDDDDNNYEFEIVCPYCNYEFTADMEDESRDEITCPECHNTIELDWDLDEEQEGCGKNCSHCESHCLAEDEEDYKVEEDNPKEETENKDNDDEDM